MNRSSFKTSVSMALLFVLALTCSSCSVINTFVVVNSSHAALSVTYRVKRPSLPGPGAPASLPNTAPRTKPADQDVSWQPLPSSRYQTDSTNRVVILSLNPGEALLLTECIPSHSSSSGNCDPADFDIAELQLEGANGTIALSGEQTHKAFVGNKNRYTLTY